MNFKEILEKYKIEAKNLRHKGDKFERLMQGYLLTDPLYAEDLSDVWLWNEFPERTQFGDGGDIGIDIVAKTHSGEYWAVQCKFFEEESHINKRDIDTNFNKQELLFIKSNIIEQITKIFAETPTINFV